MGDLETRVQSLIRSEIQNMDPYMVQDASGAIKLDAMENPYSMPDKLVEFWLQSIRGCDLNRYPDPQASGLAETVRKTCDLPDSCALLFGNGSDELIQMIIMAVAAPGAVVLAPEPTFVMYRQIAVSLGVEFIGVPLKPDSFDLDRDAMMAAIRRHRPSIVFLAYPNNPTGNLFNQATIDCILAEAPGLVVIDEAYAPFADATYMDRLVDHSCLLLMRTLSKLGLAGLRLGYLAGHPAWLEQLQKIRLPYNINALTQVTAQVALANFPLYQSQCERVSVDREALFLSLAEIDGVTPFPSRANFILFKLENRQATEVFRELKNAGVLIKDMKAKGGLIGNCLRVTIGDPRENERFVGELSRILKSQ